MLNASWMTENILTAYRKNNHQSPNSIKGIMEKIKYDLNFEGPSSLDWGGIYMHSMLLPESRVSS